MYDDLEKNKDHHGNQKLVLMKRTRRKMKKWIDPVEVNLCPGLPDFYYNKLKILHM